MTYVSYPGISFNTSSFPKVKSVAITDEQRADKIIKIVTDYFNLTKYQITSKTRERKICYPRQVAMYLMIKTTQFSLTRVGDFFGGKDHTTVIYARDHVEDLVKVDSDVREDVEYLRNKI